MPFNSVYGHDVQVRILKGMLKNGHIPHAFIFEGKKGIGKRTTAVGFVKAINCREAEDDFCDSCTSCVKVNRGVHPDFFFLKPEKDVLKIDQVRMLQQEISFKPLEAGKKVVIIDDSEKLNVQAANCLLKVLEEPPDDTVIILICSSSAGMLPTLLSRCQRIVFTPLPDTDIMKFLLEKGVEKEKAGFVVSHAGGSIDRALTLIESRFFPRRAEAARLLSCMSAGGSEDAFSMIEIAEEHSDELPLLLEFIHSFYRDVLFVKGGVPETFLYNSDLNDLLRDTARQETGESLLRKIKRIQWLRQNRPSWGMDVQIGLESIFLPEQVF